VIIHPGFLFSEFLIRLNQNQQDCLIFINQLGFFEGKA
jgi:hypothetical protein